MASWHPKMVTPVGRMNVRECRTEVAEELGVRDATIQARDDNGYNLDFETRVSSIKARAPSVISDRVTHNFREGVNPKAGASVQLGIPETRTGTGKPGAKAVLFQFSLSASLPATLGLHWLLLTEALPLLLQVSAFPYLSLSVAQEQSPPSRYLNCHLQRPPPAAFLPLCHWIPISETASEWLSSSF